MSLIGALQYPNMRLKRASLHSLTDRASSIRLPASECFELGLGYEIYYNPSGSTAITQPTSTRVLGRPTLVSADLSRGLAMNPVTVAFAGISLIWIGAAYFSAHERTMKVSYPLR